MKVISSFTLAALLLAGQYSNASCFSAYEYYETSYIKKNRPAETRSEKVFDVVAYSIVAPTVVGPLILWKMKSDEKKFFSITSALRSVYEGNYSENSEFQKLQRNVRRKLPRELKKQLTNESLAEAIVELEAEDAFCIVYNEKDLKQMNLIAENYTPDFNPYTDLFTRRTGEASNLEALRAAKYRDSVLALRNYYIGE